MQNPAKKLVRRLIKVTLRDFFVIGIPILAVIFAAFWATYQFVRPAPPNHLTISTGTSEGSYQSWATNYREIFTHNGINLEIKASKGSVENLERLLDKTQDVDIAFIQSGTTLGKDTSELVSLGVLYPEPLWLFYRTNKPVGNIDQLKGKRIAVGVEGSGTRNLAVALLEAHGIAAEPTIILPLAGLDAIRALSQGEIDAVFLVGGAQTAAAWTAFYTPGIEVFSYQQADAYVRRFPFLSEITLPRGAIDLERNIPKQDITLIATSAMLVAREDVHPALIDLMMQAVDEAHSKAGLFQKAREFPSPKSVEIPLSKDAERYYTSGKPFLQRYLPFWAATLIDRLIIMLLPVIAILYPLARVAPYLYSWRVRTRVFRYYGELKLLELQMHDAPDIKTPQQWLAELERIEQAANRIPTPNVFADQVYTLRSHVQLVRNMLMRKLDIPQSAIP